MIVPVLVPLLISGLAPSPWPGLDPAVEEALRRPRVTIRPRSWLENSGVTDGFEPAKALDGDRSTYWASNHPSGSLPKDIGAALEPPQPIARLEVDYVIQDGPWAPDPGGVALEIDAGSGFRKAQDSVEVKPAGDRDGAVTWIHSFPRVRAAAFRLVFTKAARRPAVAEIRLDLPGGMPAAWNDGSPATGVPFGSLVRAELEVPRDRPSRALGLLLSASRSGPAPDVDPARLAVEIRRPGAGGWEEAALRWRVDGTSRRRRSLALGLGEILLWAPLPEGPAEAVRISGFPGPSRSRILEILILGSLPASPAGEPEGSRPVAAPGPPGAGIPGQPGLSPQVLQEIASRRGDALAGMILSRGEPSFEELARLAVSFPGTAALGLPFASEEAGILWNGTACATGRSSDGRKFPRLFTPLAGEALEPWGVEIPVRRRLAVDGPLRVEVDSAMGALAARETALVAPGSGPEGDLHLRFRIENRTGSKQAARFAIAAVLRGWGPYPWEGDGGPASLFAESPRLDPATGVVAVGSRPIARARGPCVFLANGEESLLLSERELAPGDVLEIDLAVPLGEVAPESLAAAPGFEAAFARAGALWKAILDRAAVLVLPEPRLEVLYRASLAGLLIAADADVLPYGAFPGVYDGAVFGVEETWEMEALASFGFGEEAVRFLRGTYFRPEHLEKSTKHHQYRNGLTAAIAWRLCELTRDRKLLEEAPAVLVPLAEWTKEKRRLSGDGTEPGAPLHAGLLPKHLYGGDLEDPCHSLYGNFTCWRGLRDTALLLAEAGRGREAEALEAEAAAYRRRILEACRAVRKLETDPPFLPFRLDEKGAAPGSGDYYQLFGPLVLETGCLPRGGDLQGLVIGAIEKGPRLVARQARFGEPLGLDAHYTRGLLAEWLRAGRRADFLLGFYSQQAFAFDREVFSAPEVMPIFFDAARRREEELQRLDGTRRSDPCAAGPAVFLLSLRDLLVLEERDADDLLTGRLILGAGIPRAWMQAGAKVEAGPIATAYGPVRFSLSFSEGGGGKLAVERGAERALREYALRLPGQPDRVFPASGLRTATDF